MAGPSNRNGQRRQKPVICRSWLVQMDVGRTLKVAIAAHTCRLKLAQHLIKWAQALIISAIGALVLDVVPIWDLFRVL